jgi:hypothetical protein
MGIIAFNLVGVACFAIGGLVAMLAGAIVAIFARDPDLPIRVGGPVFILTSSSIDLAYRLVKNKEQGADRFIRWSTGGMFMLVPVWVIFGAVPVCGLSVVILGRQFGWIR